MRLVIFTLLVSFISCKSIDRFQTASYQSLAKTHKKIAVLPIHLEGKNVGSDMSEEELDKLLQQESDEIQKTLYDNIAKSSGRDKNDVKIVIKSLRKTNVELEHHGIDYSNINEVGEDKLKQILDVDAVMRTTINTSVFLTDRSEDMAKDVVKTASILLGNDMLRRATNVDMASAWVRSELVDLEEEVPIWIYDKERDIRLKDQNSEIMALLCKDVCKNFPYREENRRL